jgi:exopolysaccharide biosynthesis polyprenyl glycosylphosphotransferase
MLRRFSVNFALFSIVLDGFLIALSLILAETIRPGLSNLSFAQPLAVGDVLVPPALYFSFPLIWIAVLLLFNVYDGRRNLRVVDEMSAVTLGSALASIASAGLLYFSFRDVSRLLFASFIVIAFLLLTVWRLVYRSLQRWRGFRAAQRRVLVIGAGETGERLRVQIQNNASLGLAFVGFLDDEKRGKQILGYIEDARKVVQRKKPDDVVIALPSSAYQRVNLLSAELHDLPVRTWVIPDYFSLALHRAQIDDFAGLPLLDLRAPALSDSQRLFKRAFDVLIVLLTLPVSLLLMLFCALAIKFNDGGPVFLSQKRVGENGRVFTMLKFRTMKPSALRKKVEKDGFLHKRVDDPRVTRVGHFLRRASLDELPQLWNVFKGDMSLVGPRPELPELVEQYKPWQRKRFAVPQGLTGWWQINGRSDRPMHLHTEDDLYYVQNYSIGLDLFILLKTLWTVLSGRGAF